MKRRLKMVGTDRVFWGRRSKTLACHQYGNYGVCAGRRERGKRRRLNILVRNLSWNDRKQSYCWKREREAWREWAGTRLALCGEGELGWTAVRELVSRDVWQTQLPSLALQLPLHCWLIPLSVLMCRPTCVHVCFIDFHWLTVRSMCV